MSALLESAWSFKDYLPLISSATVILLFIIDRIVNYGIRKKEVERNFYYKVLLEPNIAEIALFFEDVRELFVSSIARLKDCDDSALSFYLSILRQEVELFKDKKRKFEFQLIYPIQLKHPKGGELLLTAINNIQDFYIGRLDSMKFETKNVIEFNQELYKLKASFLATLYKPLS